MLFCIKFYNGFILKISAGTIMLGFHKSGHIVYITNQIIKLNWHDTSIAPQ